MKIQKQIGGRGGVVHPEGIPWLSRSKIIMPFPK
jgi:hypothetical protein